MQVALRLVPAKRFYLCLAILLVSFSRLLFTPLQNSLRGKYLIGLLLTFISSMLVLSCCFLF
jgi:hypothetical protein